MVISFSIWFSLIKCLLLILLAVEQFYIFGFLYTGYQISRDRLVFLASTSFLSFFIGSTVSSIFSMSAFIYLRIGAVQEGIVMLDAGDATLSFFEIWGFGVILLLPYILRVKESSLTSILVLPFFMFLHRHLIVVNIILSILILILTINIVRSAEKHIPLHLNTVLAGLISLVSSKIIGFIPIYSYSLGTIAILLEIIAFSTFLFLREIVATTFIRKSPLLRDTSNGEI